MECVKLVKRIEKASKGMQIAKERLGSQVYTLYYIAILILNVLKLSEI